MSQAGPDRGASPLMLKVRGLFLNARMLQFAHLEDEKIGLDAFLQQIGRAHV